MRPGKQNTPTPKTEPTVTPEEKKTAEESQKNSEDFFENPDAMKAAINEAETMSTEDVVKNFDDTLGC